MDIEKLYQDVWTQVFIRVWVDSGRDDGEAARKANEAAADAVNLWDAAAAHAAISAKAKQS
jgi:hypothetical protein